MTDSTELLEQKPYMVYALPKPQLVDFHGIWKYRSDHTYFFPALKPEDACNCLHWVPEPRIGDQCPNCERTWLECEQQT